MAAEKSTAIVLKVVDFSETSCVVTLFTRDFGKVSALAKGARRPKSPFEAALDVLSVCRVVFLRKSGDSLHLLTEAKLERRFRAANRDLKRLYAAYYIVELLNRLTDELDPQPGLFDLAQCSIDQLDFQDQPSNNRSQSSASSILLHFQMRMLVWMGQAPTLDACAECSRKVQKNGRIPFGVHQGGVLCDQCRQAKRQIVSLSAAAVQGLIEYSGSDKPELEDQLAHQESLGEMRGMADQYITHLMGKQPRMLEMIRSHSI